MLPNQEKKTVLAAYLTAMIVGGVLVTASAVSGTADVDVDLDTDADVDLDADADVDADADADADADGDAGHGHGLAADFGWLAPLSSMRFWTFFLAFGGLTGTALSWLGSTSPGVTAGIAAGCGYVTGLGMTALLRRLRSEQVSSAIDDRDLLGASATVLLPVTPGAPGQVRVELKGRTVDLTARASDEEAFAVRDEVLVYEIGDDGAVVVTGASPSPPAR